MKRIILSLILLNVLLLTQSITFAKTQTTKSYDKHGNYSGKYVQDGNKIKVYDKSNNYNGYYKQDGNKVKQYSKNGNFEGSYKK